MDLSLDYKQSFTSGLWLQSRANFTYSTNEYVKKRSPATMSPGDIPSANLLTVIGATWPKGFLLMTLKLPMRLFKVLAAMGAFPRVAILNIKTLTRMDVLTISTKLLSATQPFLKLYMGLAYRADIRDSISLRFSRARQGYLSL
ncbi:hypothetical protein KRR40_33035 [Niabella defluvii]|nr:hypothetical protein KRR40_33035 [Niabella sp. I65]